MLDLKYNFNLGSDNGNPISITNNLVSDRTQTFTYDQLNRVATAYTTATHSSDPNVCWGQVFSYDSTGDWSNLLSIAGVSSAYIGCMQNSLNVGVDAYNRLLPPAATYDTAGNVMTVSGGGVFTYNQENQLCSLSSNCANPAYIYDGDGNRVEKSGSKIYWFAGSEVLDETDTTGSITNSSFNEYVFFGGARIARRDSSGNVFYDLADQLGTSRKILQAGQTAACYDADFEPFGGEHAYVNTCPQNYKFTGKERDTESSLDNFGARYYASMTGRFMTPDWDLKPVSVPYAKFGDPQTLNLYSYVENSPLNRIDADGHETGTSAVPNDCKYATGNGACSSNSGGEATPANTTNNHQALPSPDTAQNHGFWWNVGHSLGFIRTNEDVAGERQWLQKNVVSIDGIQSKDFGKLTPRQVDNEYARANAAIDEGRYNVMGTPAGSGWTLGSGKSAQKWANQMAQRGWTPDQITEAIQKGEQFPASNNINPANGATRYVNPSTGRSVVLDNATREVIHVGGDGFQY